MTEKTTVGAQECQYIHNRVILEVTLKRFRNGEIDYAARHLCEDLNRLQPVTLDRFHLPIRYHVQ